MYGGPFYSAGFVRIVNDVKYRCRHVSFARWVSLMNGGKSPNFIEVRKAGKLVAKVANEAELDAFLDQQAMPCDAAGIPYNDPRAAI